MDTIVQYLSGQTPYNSELQIFGMAIEACMTIRNTKNKDRKMNWFHAFVYSVLTGFSGGFLGFLFLGLPSSMISNDTNLAACIIAFALTNYFPFDLFYKFASTVPGGMLYVSGAQLFRAMGTIRFVNTALAKYQGTPPIFYPIPIFGPILYGVLLGNMKGFVTDGIDGYLSKGMPWPFQQSISAAMFYHFYANDQTGPIGNYLRDAFYTMRLNTIFGKDAAMDDKLFAMLFANAYLQIAGWLRMNAFLGPSFSPFNSLQSLLSFSSSLPSSEKPSSKPTTKPKSFATMSPEDILGSGNDMDAKTEAVGSDDGDGQEGAQSKKSKRKKKKNKAKQS